MDTPIVWKPKKFSFSTDHPSPNIIKKKNEIPQKNKNNIEFDFVNNEAYALYQKFISKIEIEVARLNIQTNKEFVAKANTIFEFFGKESRVFQDEMLAIVKRVIPQTDEPYSPHKDEMDMELDIWKH